MDAALARDLRALGAAAVPHVAGTLLPHLERTRDWLRRFGAREALCRAGLWHAVYGTAGIDGVLVSHAARREIAARIGDEAERIVYRYAACDRDRFHPRIGTGDELRFADRFTGRDGRITRAALRDFCELTLANELDLVVSNETFRGKHRHDLAALLARMRPHASYAAAAALRDALAPV